MVAIPKASLLVVKGEEEQHDGTFLESYKRLSMKLDLDFEISAQLEGQRDSIAFENFLAKEGIPVYDQRKVEKYLDYHVAKLGKRYHSWGWHPINKPRSHEIRYIRKGLDRFWTRVYMNSDVTENGGMFETRYSDPIPYPVLLTMEKIKDFNSNVSFYATSVIERRKVVYGDPFLAAVISPNTWYIVERWDEPGFRG